MRICFFIAAIRGLIHIIPIFLFPEYGYFRDEFYYIACAKRLAWGDVDHPPLAPFLLRVVLLTLGDSLLAHTCFAFAFRSSDRPSDRIYCAPIRRRKFAQFTAALAMALAPIFLVM